MFAWYLSLLIIPIARLSFIWTRYFTEVVGSGLFPTSLILKELFNFVFSTIFFYMHKLYKHTQTEKSLKIKHKLSIIRA